MPPWTEVLTDRAEGRQEALGLAGRLETLHGMLTVARGLVRVFGAIVEIAAPAMLHARQHLTLGRPITGQLVRDEHAWDIGAALEQLAEELLRGRLIPPALDQDIQ